MSYIKKLTVVVFALTIFGSVQAQDSEETNSGYLQTLANQLLSYQCGVKEVEDQFRLAVAKLGPELEPIFLKVLKEGAPLDVRKTLETQTLRRYDQRQAWLSENGVELFGEDTRRIQAKSREDFVGNALLRLDILFRENAVRGLGIVGGQEADIALREALETEPDLRILVEAALAELQMPQ